MDWDMYSLTSIEDDDIMHQLPQWVSLEPIEFQILWQNTAGKRPIQPPQERKYYENIWKQNSMFLDCSGNVDYCLVGIIPNKYTLLSIRSFNGNGPFGIQITHFKIIDSRANYLIKFKTPTYEFCKWMTYTCINNFYEKLLCVSNFWECINTRISWRTWKRRQSWFRNNNFHYLEMKTFLLERVLHDALYESPDIDIFYEYFT